MARKKKSIRPGYLGQFNTDPPPLQLLTSEAPRTASILDSPQFDEMVSLSGKPTTATDSVLPGVLTGVASIVGSLGTVGVGIFAAQTQAKLEKERLKREAMASQAQPQIIYAPPASSISPGLIIGIVAIFFMMFMGGMIFIATRSTSKKKKKKKK